jgi:hypothetical protein
MMVFDAETSSQEENNNRSKYIIVLDEIYFYFINVKLQLNTFLNSKLHKGEWLASRLGHFSPKKEHQLPN